MTDTYQINTEAELREVIPAHMPQTELKVFDHVDTHAREFIQQSPLIFLATADADGNMDVSPKGDAPGFVEVDSEGRHILIPDRPGNRLVYGFRNILSRPKVSVIFVVPNIRETLRINGTAQLTRDPELLERFQVNGKPALLCTDITIDECFFHCGKAMIRSKIWQSDTWAESRRVSFGKQMVSKLGGDDALVSQIDNSIEQNYKDGLY